MKVSQKLILKTIEESGVGFSNAKTHDEIKEKINTYGYGDEKLDEMLVLNSRMVETYQEYERLHGIQLESTTKLKEKFKSEMSHYTVYRKIAHRIFLEEDQNGIRSQLGLDLNIKRNFEGFLEQATQFYDASLKNQSILEGLLEIALTTEKIEARMNELSALRRLNEEQESAKGKALAARKERDASYKSLKSAWEKFKILCRFVFDSSHEYLKILNIKPYKSRVKKKVTAEDQNPSSPPSTPENSQ
jgi:hypothetical protein